MIAAQGDPLHGNLPGEAPGTAIPVGVSVEELEERYRAYRVRQARGLVSMLPREAIRPLYRRALAVTPSSLERDPMTVLVEFCESLLPLPPFAVWLEDLGSHPDAHLEELEGAADAPTPASPDTLEIRAFEYEDVAWIARLRGFRDYDTWRGFIAFEQSSSGRVHRTTLIFREQRPTDLRERFLSFESATLGAFLRSALP